LPAHLRQVEWGKPTDRGARRLETLPTLSMRR
jgi:hypothetical protein